MLNSTWGGQHESQVPHNAGQMARDEPEQRRDTMRRIQGDDLSLELVHPDAAGIDIGNESHYVAVPPSRDSQPVRRFGCTTAELKAMADKWCRRPTQRERTVTYASLQAGGVVLPFANFQLLTCRSSATICSGLCFFIGMSSSPLE
jgi:hypothetical protein